MGNSLQDQLLKAGLANKKQATKARKAKNHKEKQLRSGVDVVDTTAQSAETARQDKVERDRALNRQKQFARDTRAVQAQIRQLITLNRVAERGEISFSFDDQGTIRSLSLQEPQRRALVAGSLALVRLDDAVEVVPRAVADKIAERDASWIILNNGSATTAESDIEDEYAGYRIPDDLMW